ncbi:hypothetical protein CPHLJ_4g2034 [Cryptosporidium parvum]|uniref:Autophagy protein 5 n=1 Tax=Cryptosporidium parvum TaxID=5807 RepID=A0A7S7LH01_CRYPV|nr:Autophagy protein Apg5 [Cryptosporidium parvum]WKS77540.1 hypothetical protein CPCDC_4g2034 [Cryptosporidium sp. 43IA8]|eukprot:QOY42240.1 hypothetical protein CPATCC_001862 [Cryptosporidium parvum]
MLKIIESKSHALTHKIIHSGLLLISISIDHGEESKFSKWKCAPKLYFIIPRIGYLLSLIDTIQDYYASIDKEFYNLIENTFSWFEYDGLVINSQFPVGILFDKYHKSNDSVSFNIKLVLQYNNSNKNNRKAPFFSEENSVFNNNLIKIITNNIKLSQTVMFGDCRKLQMMNKKDYNELFDSIYSLSKTTGEYEKIIHRLFGSANEIYFNTKNIPVKIHVKNESFLRSFKKDINNQLIEIKDILNHFKFETNVSLDSNKVIFHGVALPLNTPLIFLTIFCPYIDGIVQLVIKD